MTEFYVDTTAPTDGDGLSWETAWQSVRPHLNDADLGAGDHIINCRGGVDTFGTFYNFPASVTTLTLRGNWGGFDIYEDCYRIRGERFPVWQAGGAGKTVRFENIVMESSLSSNNSTDEGVLNVVSGRVEIINSAIIGHCDIAPSSIARIVAIVSGNASAKIYNSIVTYGITPQAGNSNSKGAALGPWNNPDVANCIFSTGNYSGVTIAVTGDINDPTTINLYNCVIIGNAVNGTVTNCAVAGLSNATNVNSIIRTKEQMEAYYFDAPNGNFTPADVIDGPVDLVDQGLDRSTEIGSSLDIQGNDRNDPAAGTAWDLGLYEWGFAFVQQPYPGLHTVTNIDNASNPQCIYFGQTPTIEIGDTFSFKETTETNGWGVAIDADGFPIITPDNIPGTDSFLFDIDRGSGYNDPSEWTFTIAPPATIRDPEHLVQSGTTVLTRATTDTGSGTLYAIIDESADEPTAQQIVDGLNAAGTAADGTGSVPVTQAGVSSIITFTGLTPDTEYSYWLAQDTGELSNVVGDTITTAEPSEGIEYVLLPNQFDGAQRTNDPDGTRQPDLNLPTPQNFRITQVTASTMTLAWEFSGAGTDADGLLIQMRIPPGDWGEQAAPVRLVPIGTETVVQVGLSEGTLYGWRIASKYGDVIGTFAEAWIT